MRNAAIIGFIIGVSLTYLAFAFANWSLDAGQWGLRGRIAMALLAAIAGGVGAGIFAAFADERY